MKMVPLSTLWSKSYDLMSALDMQMDLEKLPPAEPQPPDDIRIGAPRPKPFSTKKQRIEWLMKHPGLLSFNREYIVNAMKQDGLISKNTYVYDVVVEPLVKEALRRLTVDIR